MAATGRGSGDVNHEMFITAMVSLTEREVKEMEYRGGLNRALLAIRCGFSESTLRKNLKIREDLAQWEAKFRESGWLPEEISKAQHEALVADAPNPTFDADKQKRFMSSKLVESLQLKVAELEAQVKYLEAKVRKYAPLEEALRDTGRLPR